MCNSICFIHSIFIDVLYTYLCISVVRQTIPFLFFFQLKLCINWQNVMKMAGTWSFQLFRYLRTCNFLSVVVIVNGSVCVSFTGKTICQFLKLIVHFPFHILRPHFVILILTAGLVDGLA